ncbi:hypothetical protein C8D92_106198 [Tamilnaduibacter salinus]|uniref:Serine aminopeptidase S33 domain-containing protein n=1 Tax=Tamilnaduibacter salinus TaxID=1484056 RepID=A0A2U1CW17_9GAMM|nr:alpha/beta hydrolase [Tamilnaduibacter salinus]PVY75937.1 hypothetical protein C8D92_106198 [Tamilnaduibacter salinus]
MAHGAATLLLIRRLPFALLALLALLQTGCGSLFFYPDQTVYITPDRLNLDYEDVYVETPDDETLHGWWLPAHGDAKGTVYFLHGNAQNISSHLLNVAWLPERHYNVFILDYRGYGQSTGEPDIPGALTDARAGMEWIAGNHDQSPVFLLGQSLGGGLGTVLAERWQTQDQAPPLQGVILDSTFSGFRAIAREKLDGFWLTWPFQIPLSWTIPGEYEGVERLPAIHPTPVMVIHSVRDPVIPYHHGRTLFEAAKEPKRFLKTDTAHAGTFVIPAYREAVLAFMAKHKKTD